MLKNVKNLEELKAEAIKIKNKERRIVFWPQFNRHKVETYSLTDEYFISEWTYNTNNAVIAFYEQEILYVIPFFSEGMAILETEGFKRTDMYVPFSNHEYPVVEQAHWKRMIEESKGLLVEGFREECIENAKIMGITPIDQQLLDERCIRIPDEGILVNNEDKEPERKFPAIVGYCCDNAVMDYLGRYFVNINNGIITFINADGVQYVTKSEEIHKQLFDRGYKFRRMEEIFGDGDEPADDEVMSCYTNLTIA